MIELRHVSKHFSISGSQVQALTDVSLNVESGEVLGLIGSSGAGKSTLLRLINLLERPDAGQVLVEGQDLARLGKRALAQQRRQIGMIFQQFNLLEAKTVFDNIALPLRLAHVPEPQVRARVGELLDYVELSDKARTYPSRLSGGQKQRVGIARALSGQPRILLSDEATSALDPDTTASILALLRRINRDLGITVIMVTHEMQVIADVCSHVGVLSAGRLVEHGRVLDVFAAPSEPITQRFVRTVINDTVPAPLLSTVEETRADQQLWRITARGEAATAPLLSEFAKRHGIETRILNASIHEIDGAVLSVLVVQALGHPEALHRARFSVPPHGPTITVLDYTALAAATKERIAA